MASAKWQPCSGRLCPEAENLSSAAAYLTEMAKAVVDSVMSGSTTAKPGNCAQDHAIERLAALHRNGALIINPEVSRLERNDAKGFLDWASQQVKGGAQ